LGYDESRDLFAKLKMKPKGQRFETVSDIEREPQAVLNSIKENEFHGAFEAWKKAMKSPYTFQNNYFEGHGNQN
jgi:hypothetical protein